MFMGVTHELKTPLAAVQLGVDTLRRVKLSAEDEASVLGNIQTGVKDLERRVNDMLVATRLQGLSEVKAAPFSLGRGHEVRGGPTRTTPKEVDVSRGPSKTFRWKGTGLGGWPWLNLIENALKHFHTEGARGGNATGIWPLWKWWMRARASPRQIGSKP